MVAVEREVPEFATGPSADAIPLNLRRQGGTPRQVLAIALIGTFVLAAFASHDLSAWLGRLGDGLLLVPSQQAAAQWDDAMNRLGLTWPAEALRSGIGRLLDWQWGEPP